MPKKTFERLKQEKKRRIERALLKVFNELGYDQTTVTDIVEAASIPRGSFYQYFEDKYDAFCYLISEVQIKKMTYMEPFIEQLGKTPFIKMYIDMVFAGLRFIRDYPDYAALGIQLYRSREAPIAKLWRELELSGVTMMTDMLKIDQAAGYSRPDIDMSTVAKMLYRLNAMDILEEFLKGADDETLKKMTMDYIKIIRHGIEKEV